MKLDFDRNIEGIQLAAPKAGYQFERFWLPWRTESQPRGPSQTLRTIFASITQASWRWDAFCRRHPNPEHSAARMANRLTYSFLGTN